MTRTSAPARMILRSLMPVLIAGAWLQGAGCGSSLPGQYAGDACAIIANKTYVSVNQMECGLGPNGVAYCNWNVAFSADGTFDWRHSDVVESGSYTCNGAAITGTRGSAAPVAGMLDANVDRLTWDGAAYVFPTD
jgi:hypothetical protein